MTSHAARSGLKQETVAIVAVGVTILGTILFATSRLESRLEVRIERVEARIDRIAAEIRAEARADRDLFAREILRLTAEQSRLTGIVEGARPELAPSDGAIPWSLRPCSTPRKLDLRR